MKSVAYLMTSLVSLLSEPIESMVNLTRSCYDVHHIAKDFESDLRMQLGDRSDQHHGEPVDDEICLTLKPSRQISQT